MRILALICSLLLVCFHTLELQASAATDLLRGNAKFNSVIAVLAIIFCGIVFFLFRMDRRLQKLEKNREEKK